MSVGKLTYMRTDWLIERQFPEGTSMRFAIGFATLEHFLLCFYSCGWQGSFMVDTPPSDWFQRDVETPNLHGRWGLGVITAVQLLSS